MTTDNTAGIDWCCLPDADTVCARAASRILAAAAAAIAARGCFRMVLAGGRTPVKVYRLLAASDADWPAWQIYYGDERCLPGDDAERNSVMAAEAWLNQVAHSGGQCAPHPGRAGGRGCRAGLFTTGSGRTSV